MPSPSSTQTEEPKPGVLLNVNYAPGAVHALNIYIPLKETNSPLVVFVHGGAWQGGSRSEYDPVCEELQQAGIASATVDYELSPTSVHPGHAKDVTDALAWLNVNFRRFGFDPGRVFVVGHSAGGHIAGTIATDSKLFGKAHVAGFVGVEGIYDIPKLAQRWPTYPQWFLNKAFGGDTSKWAAASPSRLPVAGKVPWLLVHSKGDELVDLGQTNDFAAHLKSAGVPVKLVYPEKKSHDGVIKSLVEPKDEVLAAIIAFVKGH